MNDYLIKLDHVDAGYKENPVLKNVNLTIREQDFLGIIGPNGGGKTTLLKVILRLLKPTAGSVDFVDKNLKNQIGYLPQTYNIDKKFPILVSEVVASGLISEKSFTREQKQERVSHIMAEMGLQALANKPIGTLSGGELQRTLLARAVVNEPRLLILDEPDSYVDQRFESYLYEFLQKINRQTAIILVSHNIETVKAHAKNVARVNGTLQYG
jgi:zinc transport system ATP-binding protein